MTEMQFQGQRSYVIEDIEGQHQVRDETGPVALFAREHCRPATDQVGASRAEGGGAHARRRGGHCHRPADRPRAMNAQDIIGVALLALMGVIITVVMGARVLIDVSSVHEDVNALQTQVAQQGQPR